MSGRLSARPVFARRFDGFLVKAAGARSAKAESSGPGRRTCVRP